METVDESREVIVTVICVIYNQEMYLEKCLEGFVEQKTDFPFEVILHDDASKDNSPEIIKRYCERYSDIFVPILQKENQYSKKIPFFKRLLDEAKGKYIALCEGDDYWCDPYKLQKQYDYMKCHPECSMCVHNTVIHDLNMRDTDVLFMNDKATFERGYLTEKQVFNYWIVHYSSYFIRNNYDIIPDEWSLFFWARDYVMLTVACANGRIGVLKDVSSVYNSNNQQGLTAQNARSSDALNKKYDRAAYLREFLNHYQSLSDEIKAAVCERIDAIEEYRAVNEFCESMLEKVKSSDKTDEEKFEWLIKALNNERLVQFCTNPSEGLETLSYKSTAKRMFEMVYVFLCSLKSLGDAIYFSFVSWISELQRSDSLSKEYLLAIAAAPENEAGWGMKLSGDSVSRYELVCRYADEGKLTEDQKKELILHRNAAIASVDSGDMRKGLSEVNMALGISPLNRDLICYKAFILLCLREKDACLNEIGIYNLFYEMGDDIMMIYEKAQSL